LDQYTRRIIGFGIQAGVVDGMALCRMFKQAILGEGPPEYLSSDHDPLYRFHQWAANLRILGISEIKTVPYTFWSHPFVERLIGAIRRECLDRSKHLNRRARVFDRTVGDNIVVGSIKQRWRREEEFAMNMFPARKTERTHCNRT
jgi:hypothetical protein